MQYKESIESLLDSLKILNIDRRKIEIDLGYSENYLDQALSKGGNKRLLNLLEKYYKNVSDEVNSSSTNQFDDNDPLNRERSLLKVLLIEVAKLSAKVNNRSIDSVLDEIRQNTMIEMNSLQSGNFF